MMLRRIFVTDLFESALRVGYQALVKCVYAGLAK